MAHQCWNDGTDRSTLPIHGMSVIGIYCEATAAELAQHGTFFETAKLGCLFSSLAAFLDIAALVARMFPFDTATLTVQL